MRRTWIEIVYYNSDILYMGGRPPCGGRGLKFHIVMYGLIRLSVVLHAEDVD